jgi:ankyrin repeat protein
MSDCKELSTIQRLDTLVKSLDDGDEKRFVEQLLSCLIDGASIDHTDNDGTTALMGAAIKGHTSVVEVLLADARVDKTSIDHADNTGFNALMWAAF